MAQRNFLLGKGERLAEAVTVKSFPGVKADPYTFNEAKSRLTPMVDKVVNEVEKLPALACPDDLAVAAITINPEYIAKSYFPSELLRIAGLRAVGSKAKKVIPEKRSRDRKPEETFTTELFVAGERSSFRKWAETFKNLGESDLGAAEIIRIEEISFQTPAQKLKVDEDLSGTEVYEIVLHLDQDAAENRYLSLFENYLKKGKLKPDFKHRFYAGGLCFLEIEAPQSSREYIAQFSLVRVVRTMPALRLLRPVIRKAGPSSSMKVELPTSDCMDPKIKVAIFDGGIPKGHPILKWATNHDVPGIGKAVSELEEHGVGVTSAFLFGHIDPKAALARPYASVDHFRVLDDVPGSNPFELYEILDRIKDVIDTTTYDFINLSLGPQLPIDDDEVHAWTAVLDDYLSKQLTLATIAVGNDGDGDSATRANRVQVPSDCVNALGIGACDVPDAGWRRADYSSIGPGRSPGITKPDLVEFGGSIGRPFLTLNATDGKTLVPFEGTSFSSPSVLRLGAGVRAHFGTSLNPLAIRTLLTHCSEAADFPKDEIGFGRVARHLDDIVVCDDRSVRVVFQGRISARKYLRIPIPLPKDTLPGMVTIKATLVYTTAVDPHHPGNYTRSGLEVFFRPHKDVKSTSEDGRPSVHAKTSKFFGSLNGEFQTETELRRDALKWENCMKAEKKMRGTSLKSPVFDIHYNARQEGANDPRSQEIDYSLVIAVEARKVPDLYDRIFRQYATILEQLTPVIDLPVRV